MTFGSEESSRSNDTFHGSADLDIVANTMTLQTSYDGEQRNQYSTSLQRLTSRELIWGLFWAFLIGIVFGGLGIALICFH